MTAEDGTPISDERHLLPQHQDTADLSAFCRELSVIGATSSAYHRTVIDRFGPVVDELAYWDRVSPFRAAMLGTIVFVPEVLVLYRRHSGSIVSKVFYQQEDDAVQDYQRRMIKNTRNMIAVNEQWLDDLAAIDPPQRAACEQVIRGQLAARRFELGVEDPRFAARLRAYVQAARDGVPLGPTTRQFAKRAIAPVYHWWIRRNAERLCRRLG